MWANLLKYLGVELIKAIVTSLKDWLSAYKEQKKIKERDANRKKRESLLIALEVARQNGDAANVDRISSELLKLSDD